MPWLQLRRRHGAAHKRKPDEQPLQHDAAAPDKSERRRRHASLRIHRPRLRACLSTTRQHVRVRLKDGLINNGLLKRDTLHGLWGIQKRIKGDSEG